jgi:O-antigen ligase
MTESTHQIVGCLVVAAAFFLVPVWRIHKRAGLLPALSLLILVPFAGVVVSSLILAFSRWPATRRRSELGNER